MKKLLLLAAAAVGVAVVAKSRSDQLKATAAKVTSDPRVQSALATATEKAGPVASSVKEKAGPVVSQVGERVSAATDAASSFAHDKLHHNGTSPETPVDASPVEVPDVPAAAQQVVEETDPVSAPEFTGFETGNAADDAAGEEPRGSGPAEE